MTTPENVPSLGSMTNATLIRALIDDIAKHGEREVRVTLRSGTMPVLEVESDTPHVCFLRTRRVPR